ncbi:hypothetical protein BGW39_009850 [Mortierella sp. 14UC]|nr:hypothetical protein BGW39_009850 [Mortierella sp. 14UC]
MGIVEQHKAIAKPFSIYKGVRELGEQILELDYTIGEELLIPPHKIIFKKRVLTIVEEVKVKIQNAAISVYEGDIPSIECCSSAIVRGLEKEGKLPKSDQEDLPFNVTYLVGQTEPLDVEEFPN